MSLPLMIKAGQFPGADGSWSKFGTGNVTTAWSTVFSAGANPGLYVYALDGDPSTVAIASTDVDDTALGAGCTTVRVGGLDELGRDQSETFTTSGQTPVTGTKLFSRVFRVENMTLNPGQDCQGQLYVGRSDAVWVGGEPDVILGHMNDGYNQSQMVMYTVPKDFTLLVFRVTITTANKTGEAGFYFRNSGLLDGIQTTWVNKVPYYLSGSPLGIDVQQTPFQVNSGVEFELRAKSDQSVMGVACNITGVLMPNRYFPKIQ